MGATKQKIGTTIFGTYANGPGTPNQGHLVFAVNAKRWWFFTVTNTSDTSGNPGTHTIKCYYSDRVDLSTAVWTAGTSSPNFDASGTGVVNLFHDNRSVGLCYVNNSGGSKKDIIILCASMFDNTGSLAETWSGLIRAILTANTITWEIWGGWSTPAWNSTDSGITSGNVVGVTADGYVQIAGGTIHSELDCTALTTLDQCTQDVWTAGGITATANVASGSALITNMSNQTGLKVGMSISNDSTDWNGVRIPKINSIDSGTQVTSQSTATTNGTATNTRWWQATLGANRTNSVMDSTMVHECSSYAFASLDDGNMVCVYDNGGVAPPNVQNLKSMKSNQTQANGFWPSTTDGTGSVNVFGSNVTIDLQDWCLDNVDRNHIYCFRRTGNTSIEMNKYSVAGNTWSAVATQPPAATGVIKAGGGIVAIDNGFDLWLFYIDGTNNNIMWIKHSVSNVDWGSWAILCAVGSTASKLACSPVLGPISGVQSQAGLVWAETNGGSYDAYTVGLLVGDPPDWDGIDNRLGQYQRLNQRAIARGR